MAQRSFIAVPAGKLCKRKLMPDRYFTDDQYFISKLKPKTLASDEF